MQFLKQHALAISLTLILLVGASLRLVLLNQLPSGLNRDEAALAYNAKLLKETGRDEWGVSWPLTLRSFGDYKLPGYVWATIGSFTLFGYSDWSVRLPSALAGVVLIWLSYRFARDVLSLEIAASLTVALFVALSPVTFFYSRMAFEANLALTLTVAALWCWWAPRKNHFPADLLGVACIVLALCTYNTPLLLLPIIAVLTWWVRGPRVRSSWVLSAALLIVCVSGILAFLPATRQKQGITIFSDETLILAKNERYTQLSGVSQKLLGNQYVFWAEQIAHRYAASWGPVFVIVKGGTHPWHALPHFGHLFWSVYVLSIGGVVAVGWQTWRERSEILQLTQWRASSAFLLLVIATPLPATITVDAPHATRSLLFLWGLILLAGLSVKILTNWARTIPVGRYVLLAIFLVFTIEAMRYQHSYWTSYPNDQFALFKSGFAPAIQAAPANQPVAVIDDQGYHYILTAWYLQLPPEVFFSTVERHLPDLIGFSYGYELRNFRFIAHPNDKFPEEKYVLTPNPSSWHLMEY
jgi:4-amino-4-deoxy-L-arabinose transferase-like glycosyltransferase